MKKVGSLVNSSCKKLFHTSLLSGKIESSGTPNPFCKQFFFSDGGDGVEIEIEGVAGEGNEGILFLEEAQLLIYDQATMGQNEILKEMCEELEVEVEKVFVTPLSVNVILKEVEGVYTFHRTAEEEIKEFLESMFEGEKREESLEYMKSQKQLGSEDYFVEEVIDMFVRPYLAQDGGDIELIKYEDDVAKVRLYGACSGCPSRGSTLNNLVFTILEFFFPNIKSVEEV